MIASKYITRIIAVLMSAAVLLCMCAVAFQDQLLAAAGDTGITMDYETALFDTSQILSVNILMDQDDWDSMLANATSEEYYECSVEINGETYHHVAIRPKGNTSLTSIASDPDTDRFSLKLEFDHFVEGQTCHGLDKLILNNNYADATNMKEALIYDMYQYMGVDASLYNYASISVNGEYWGVYLALEAVEDSFMLRNYGTQNGELYKPDSLNIGGTFGDSGDMDFSDIDPDSMDFSSLDMENADFSNMTPPDGNGDFNSSDFDFSQFGGTPPDGASSAEMPETADGTEAPSAEMPDTGSMDFSTAGGFSMGGFSMGGFSMGGFSMGGFSMGGSGADLNYTDDDLDSYSTIWEGEVTDSGKTDHKRVVAALKQISEGIDLEEVMDVENLLGYMAVHVFSVNDDSLTGAMAHNYYLYESDGKLNIIPWDYNLSLGGMGSSNDATTVVNDAIDDAFTGTDFFDTMMEDETWHEEYYEKLHTLVEDYVNGGAFDEFYDRVRSQIDSLVEDDPTAFYSYDEYLEAADTLYQVVKLRGESIEAQLDGSIASYASHRSDSDQLIDASGIDLSVMGSMDTGNTGGFAGMTMPDSHSFNVAGEDDTEAGEEEDEEDEKAKTPFFNLQDPTEEEDATSQDGEDTTENVDPSQLTGGQLPDGVDPSQFGGELPEGVDPSQFSGGDLPEGVDPSQFNGGDLPEGVDPSQFSGGDLPEGVDPSQFSGGATP